MADFLNDLFSADCLKGARLEKIEVAAGMDTVRFFIRMPVFDTDVLDSVRTYISGRFPKRNCSFEFFFAPSAFCKEAVSYVIDALRQDGFPANGFFRGAEYSLDGDEVQISLASKCLHSLQALNFNDMFAQKVDDIFSKNVSLIITEPDKALNMPVSDAPSAEALKALKEKQTLHLNPTDMANRFLPLENDIYEAVYGKKPSLSSIVSIKAAVDACGKQTICGDVIEMESKELRNGSVVRNILITDYVDSIYMKTYDDDGKYKCLDNLKAGTTIVSFGEVSYDEREKAYVFRPFNVIKVNRAKQHDDEPEKRIELHLHTNMSQMDALPSAAAVINRAVSLGHHAVAITDHGAVQAFPDAFNALGDARKKIPDFKVIYGCEAYYVDDSANIVNGPGDLVTVGEVVCFDLETTGFDCENDRMIEIGACIVRDGQICETFDTFVDPGFPIPDRITQLTGIGDRMVSGAPGEKEALEKFIAFAAGRPLVAHNASFDMSFIEACCLRHGSSFYKEAMNIDTMALAQSLLPELAHHKLDTLTKYFKLSSFNHHRGSDDAVALARIYLKLIELLNAQGIDDFGQVNSALGGRNISHAKVFHMILLVKDQAGLKNLYTLVSKSNVDHFHGKPRMPLSEILKYREGLLIGSACEAGEVYRAVLEHRNQEYLDRICAKYDFFEIQPRCNNMFMVREGTLESEKDVLDINRRIVELADRLGKPCVATCDVHFLDEKDGIYRQIILSGMGFSDTDEQAPLVYRTTRQMLDEFAYLGEAKAKEIVVTNPAAIAEQCSPDIRPIPDGTFNPSIEGSEEQITATAMNKIKELYGDNPDAYVLSRAKQELDSICGHGYAVLYLIAQKLVEKSESDGYHVGSRGSVGSSYVAFLLGISEVNPLPVHYRCPNCKHFEYTDDAADGYDLLPKACPVCGTAMEGDGHNIPFETFLGFKGDKCPDIDLNFSSEYQSNIFKYTEELFGSDYVFKAGTVMALQDKNALGYVKKYEEEKGIHFSKAEQRRLSLGCTGVKKSTGQHPGGMVVIPNGRDINDFTPVQRPADKTDADFITTHFDFNSLHDTLLKLDELGHEIPTTYHYLEHFSGMNIADVPANDREVMKLFTSPEPLGITKEDIQSDTGTLGIPEMGTVASRKLLFEAQPKGVADLIQISGLSHGTGVWVGNAQDLIRDGTCTISEVIGTRDGIMTTLIGYGLDNQMAFKIMEFVRKNKKSKPLPDEMVAAMREHDVPEWYIDSCRKIQYMFPKAHAVAYVTSAVKLAWFKLYRPLEYYAAYFTVRGMGCAAEFALGNVEKVRSRMREVDKLLQDFSTRTAKTEDEMVSLQMLQEIKCRGIGFLPVDIMHSHYKRYEIEDGKLRLPFVALTGVGENAAKSLYDAAQSGSIYTAEDLLGFPGVSQSLIDTLDSIGALGNMPKTAQVSFW